MIQASNTNHIIRLPGVIGTSGLSRASIYRLAKLGLFPKPVKIGLAAVGWNSTDIDVWLSERKPSAIVQ